jgi:hypothetical protein
MLRHPFHVEQFPVLHVSIDTAMAVGIADRTERFQYWHFDTSVIDIRMSSFSSAPKTKFASLLSKQRRLSWQLFLSPPIPSFLLDRELRPFYIVSVHRRLLGGFVLARNKMNML